MSTLTNTMFACPPVFATAGDIADLRALAATANEASFGASMFRQECARLAVPALAAAPRFVRLGNAVTYRDLRSKTERQVRVVRPDHSDAEENHVSVFAPIGAALIGLSEGAIFRWTEPDGRLRAIKVLNIET